MKTTILLFSLLMLSGCAINPVASLGNNDQVWVADKHDTLIYGWTNILYCQANKSADGKSAETVCFEAKRK